MVERMFVSFSYSINYKDNQGRDYFLLFCLCSANTNALKTEETERH